MAATAVKGQRVKISLFSVLFVLLSFEIKTIFRGWYLSQTALWRQ